MTSTTAGAVASGEFAILLEEHRRTIADRVLSGASGADTLAAMTEFVDNLIVGRYRDAIRQAGGELSAVGMRKCCVMALGGYGRRELAPHSDIDLMFLFRPGSEKQVEALIRAILHPLWDCGFQVGHSMRTVADSMELAETDCTVKTSMMEARFLAGSSDLFQDFHRRYLRRVVSKNTDLYLDQKLEERRREYEKFGETVYLLEPNVKKSKGGLRDLHLLQWAGIARFQAPTIRELSDRGILSRADSLALTDARDFLWRVRALLHVHAGTAQEILNFDEQVWLARHFGFHDQPHLLAVEQFMQQYYQHTMGLHERCLRFVERCRSVPFWQRVTGLLPAPRVEEYFVIRGGVLGVAEEHRVKVLDSPALLVRLFDVARAQHVRIAPPLLEDIHRHVEQVPDDAYRTPDVSKTFLKILAGPGTTATLEAMHRAHLLEKIVPAMGTVRGLMQFNQYHKYTVDEHSLLAVGRAEALGKESTVLGEVYRSIKRKDILHLAVLMHDLGKGREEDHSEVGKRLAEEVAARLSLDEQETRTLSFLVYRHLLMAHTAFRRDPNDEKVVLPFAREVATPEVLKKLLALTAADIAAVGPGVLTKWKESLLVELYVRTMPEVSGDRDTAQGPERLGQIVDEVTRQPMLGGNRLDRAWIEDQLTQFPDRYVYGTAPARIAAHMAAVQHLHLGDVLVESDFNDDLAICEYSVITRNDLTPGIFSKIAGVMTGSGLQILDAQILTRRDGVVVDTFQVTDPDYLGKPPEDRRKTVGDRIAAVLKGWDHVDDVLRRGARLRTTRPLPKAREATEVRIDNETSDGFTIIDVFADDRQGLLYVITNAIFQLGLSIHAARISTRLDQAADVFYVADHAGRKLQDHAQLERVRAGVEQAIEQFLEAKAA
ncbi:[protein-PII] uridylyltransferase [Nitrospira sp. KM1]|uniref:[protein-PII] uridylyltransferase n=1 Tax=Nitrospira sp. KM1 TaxID=1936990 RepID=UPI001E5AF693|nr:[protein-PII] uridylyltransferase [Nitrospira sp. KM1]